MKLFKKIFKNKDKLSYKYESNTLAELNESPDMRLSTAKEREEIASSYPVVKAKKVTKSTKAAPKTAPKTTPKSTAPKVISTHENKESSPVATQEKTVKAIKSTSATKSPSTKKAPTQKQVSAPKADTKNEVKANKPTKKAVKAEDPKSNNVLSISDNDNTNEQISEEKPSKTGKFEIKKTKDGRFVFNLYASNNVIIATSQIYSSSTSALNGIRSIIANAAIAKVEDQTLKTVNTVPYPKWEIYRDKSEQFRFRLSASNGSCVCHSQGYTSKTNCKKGIESIIKFAENAEITKTYINKDK